MHNNILPTCFGL